MTEEKDNIQKEEITPDKEHDHSEDIYVKGERMHYVPDSQIRDLLRADSYNFVTWKMFKIMAEFVDGFEMVRKYHKAVTFFGTARAQFGDHVYREATELGGYLAKAGFEVVTGGGPGVMEAANKGAYEAGGKSIGININLPAKKGGPVERKNPYITESENFDYFFVRKTMLSFASQVYVFFPGGFGTMDEFFEMATLVQTKKLWKVPIILVGEEYWTPLLEFIEKVLYEKNNAIAKEDLEIYTLVKDAEEAFDLIQELDEEGKVRGKSW